MFGLTYCARARCHRTAYGAHVSWHMDLLSVELLGSNMRSVGSPIVDRVQVEIVYTLTDG